MPSETVAAMLVAVRLAKKKEHRIEPFVRANALATEQYEAAKVNLECATNELLGLVRENGRSHES